MAHRVGAALESRRHEFSNRSPIGQRKRAAALGLKPGTLTSNQTGHEVEDGSKPKLLQNGNGMLDTRLETIIERDDDRPRRKLGAALPSGCEVVHGDRVISGPAQPPHLTAKVARRDVVLPEGSRRLRCDLVVHQDGHCGLHARLSVNRWPPRTSARGQMCMPSTNEVP